MLLMTQNMLSCYSHQVPTHITSDKHRVSLPSSQQVLELAFIAKQPNLGLIPERPASGPPGPGNTTN